MITLETTATAKGNPELENIRKQIAELDKKSLARTMRFQKESTLKAQLIRLKSIKPYVKN